MSEFAGPPASLHPRYCDRCRRIHTQRPFSLEVALQIATKQLRDEIERELIDGLKNGNGNKS